MNYELAVLAALIQLDAPNTPKLVQVTGISTRRVQIALDNLRSTLQVAVVWTGPKRTGHYTIESWGVFETGAAMRRLASTVNLAAYRQDRQRHAPTLEQKQNYLNQIKLDNYRHSLALEGFSAGNPRLNLSLMNKQARDDLKTQLKKRYMKVAVSAAHDAR